MESTAEYKRRSAIAIKLMVDIVGATHLSVQEEDRARYGTLRPSIVVWPGTVEEISKICERARHYRWKVAVLGSGKRSRRLWPEQKNESASVRIALVMTRIADIELMDSESLVVGCQCGIQLRHLESALSCHGLTLGPLTPRSLSSTVGGLLAAPKLARDAPLGDFLHNACVALSAFLPGGRYISTRIGPSGATGPDLARLFLGRKGALAILVNATLRVFRRPTSVRAQAFVYSSADAAITAARALAQTNGGPARMQVLLNESALRAFSGTPFPLTAMLAFSHEGLIDEVVQACAADAFDKASAAGGSELPRDIVDRWHQSHQGKSDQHEILTPVCYTFRFSRLTARIFEIIEYCGQLDQPLWIDRFTAEGADICVSSPSPSVCMAKIAADDHQATHRVRKDLARSLDPDSVLLGVEGSR